MTKTYTLNDLLRYIYDETSAEEKTDIEVLIANDEAMQQLYADFLEMIALLDNLWAEPSDEVVNKILEQVKTNSDNFHSV